VDNTIYLLTLPLSTIKRIRKAVNILTRAGVIRETAIELILDQHRNRYAYKR
jgi:hypothetical protein